MCINNRDCFTYLTELALFKVNVFIYVYVFMFLMCIHINFSIKMLKEIYKQLVYL